MTRTIAEARQDAYRYCGKIDALPNAEVELLGWVNGAQAAPAMRAIRDRSTLGLAAAKAAVDACLAGKAAGVPTKSVTVARELVEQLARLGVAGTITYGG